MSNLALNSHEEMHTNQSFEFSAALPVDEGQTLSFAQERRWFLEQAYPHHPMHTLALGIRLLGVLDYQLLDRAIANAVRQHAILSWGFDITQGITQPESATDTLLPIDNIGNLPRKDEQAVEIQRWCSTVARMPIELVKGLLIRANLLAISSEEHLLMLTGHRIACDRESLEVLMQEVYMHYDALLTGLPVILEESLVTFSDFVDWQRRSEVGSGLLSYWQRQLAGAVPVLELPLDHSRPAIQNFRGVSADFSIPDNIVKMLRTLGQRLKVDLDAILFAAYSVLLHRYAVQDDILVGVRTSYREKPKWQGVIGPLDNTLVIRCRFPKDQNTNQLLQRVSELLQEAGQHSDLAFEQLIKGLQADRNLAYSPLVQALFSCRDANHQIVCGASGLNWQPFEVDNGSSVCDLSLNILFQADSLNGSLVYDPALFSATTIDRMLAHYTTLLADMADEGDQPVYALNLLTAAERNELIIGWNDTQAEYPEDSSIVELFKAQALKTPDAIAVISCSQSLSYRELDRQSNRLARRLFGYGVARETLVGVSIERSAELFVAVLGILKAGGCYVPLDPAYPAERLRYMIEISGLRVLVTNERLLSVLSSYVSTAICVGLEQDAIDDEDDHFQSCEMTADNLVYVVFTSGSTGRPKGVAVEQRQLLNRFSWMWREYPFGAKEISALKTSLNFVDSLWELLGPLLKGIPSAVIPEEAMRDPWQLVEQLAAYRVTRIMLVPSLLKMILDTHDNLEGILPDLQTWCIGGEPLTVELSRRFAKLLPGRLLLNLYGLSETFDACYYDTSQLAEDASLVPIGRPIDNVQVYVLDAHLQMVPVGIAGELCLGGAGLARGYLNRPDLTDEKFLPNPFSTKPDARIYRTGDRVRFRADGIIEYLGRIDHQVKIRGYRIEPDEIAALLCSHSGVCQAVVVCHEDGPDGPRLAAYFVPEAEQVLPTVAELHGFLKERLPDYMLPATYQPLSALPLTASGKVDRLSLPKAQVQGYKSETAYIAPRNDIERAIVEIWQRLLKLDRVGLNDNFFDIGGTSILIVQANQKLRQRLNRTIPIMQMYHYPSASSLAQSMSQIEDECLSSQEVGRARADIRRDMMSRRRRTEH